MQFNIVGWDIGGAHVKAAVINRAGEIIHIVQKPCPLWKGIDQLHHAVNTIMQDLAGASHLHVITMTGELVDLFVNRADGVKQIIDTMNGLLAGMPCLIFAGYEGFLMSENVEDRYYEAIASANWLASALFAAQKVEDGLFIDIGSTTTDILILKDSQVPAEGYTDYQRLISQELIYTGIVRTPVMAVAKTARDQGKNVGLMAEHFATMADVYRLTGELNELHDQTETADGEEKTVIASARRLSRMIGCDFMIDELSRWQRFAENLRSQQLQKIQRGCEAQLSRHRISRNNPIIGAGIGRFLVRQLALNLGYSYLDFAEFFAEAPVHAGLTTADCAPAVAVACLAREYFSKAIVV
ncbi:MAG: hydantoinase/oxoprolinase family protein [Methylobacter sp.]|nr:hydantoinase/oxoprolinase family protein [Methylobacter sp.]